MPAQSTLDRLRDATVELIRVAKPLATPKRRELSAAIAAAESAVATRPGRPKRIADCRLQIAD